MKKARLIAIALVVVLMSITLLLPLSAAAAPSHASAPTTTRSVTNRLTGLPVNGTTSAGDTFKGVWYGEKLSWEGEPSRDLIPISLIDPSCSILTPVIGPIHFNLLRLVVDISQITVTITAQPGTLLGGLLCQLVGATTLQQIVALLDQILALLGG